SLFVYFKNEEHTDSMSATQSFFWLHYNRGSFELPFVSEPAVNISHGLTCVPAPAR
ncbi:hypothetical protein ACJX0J_010507, partial [Zea mays]